jgi:hypothetical protein
VESVPQLLRRIQQELCPSLKLLIAPPLRTPRSKLVKKDELERAVELVARKTEPPRAILILVDSDDDPPCTLGPELLQRARQARPDVPIGLVLAKREFEAWFLASLESLAGKRGLPATLAPIGDPEAVRDAKRQLTRRMSGSRAYSSVADQPALTALFDMDLARSRSDSFDKCWREIARLLTQVTPLGQGPRAEDPE